MHKNTSSIELLVKQKCSEIIGLVASKNNEFYVQDVHILQHLFSAPPAFKPKQSHKRPTESRLPFSTNRNIHVPVSKGIEIKKSDKATTKIIEPKKRPDIQWQVIIQFSVLFVSYRQTIDMI